MSKYTLVFQLQATSVAFQLYLASLMLVFRWFWSLELIRSFHKYSLGLLYFVFIWLKSMWGFWWLWSLESIAIHQERSELSPGLIYFLFTEVMWKDQLWKIKNFQLQGTSAFSLFGFAVVWISRISINRIDEELSYILTVLLYFVCIEFMWRE